MLPRWETTHKIGTTIERITLNLLYRGDKFQKESQKT